MNLSLKKKFLSKKSNEVDSSEIFAKNNLFSLKKDFDPASLDLNVEEFTQVAEFDQELRYYVDNKMLYKKVFKENQEIMYVYDNKIIKQKVTKITNASYIDYKVVTYDDIKKSILYRFKNNTLQKKAIFFFKGEYKYRASIYTIRNNTVSTIERLTYDKETGNIRTKTHFSFQGVKTSIVFQKMGRFDDVVQKNTFTLVDGVVDSVESDLLAANTVTLHGKKHGGTFKITTIINSKFGTNRITYEMPAEVVNKTYAFHEGDYNDISILKADDDLCLKSNCNMIYTT